MIDEKPKADVSLDLMFSPRHRKVSNRVLKQVQEDERNGLVRERNPRFKSDSGDAHD